MWSTPPVADCSTARTRSPCSLSSPAAEGVNHDGPCSSVTRRGFGDDGGHAGVAAERIEGGDVFGEAAVELGKLHVGAEGEVVVEVAEGGGGWGVGVVEEADDGGDAGVELGGEHSGVLRADLDELVLDRGEGLSERLRGVLDGRGLDPGRPSFCL